MPRRRDKRTDTQNSDDYDDKQPKDAVTYYGAAQFNRFLAPDKIQGDDVTKYSIRAWTNTLQAQRLLQWPQRKQLFQRALNYLPYSYKVWAMYLSQYMDFCSGRSLLSKQYRILNETFEKALEKLPKMPRIWIMYCQCLDKQHLVSKVRAVYNWSFKNLPLTQHQKIWHKFSTWSMKLDNTVTALNTIPRYLKLNPDFKEQYADYLYDKKLYNKCLIIFQQILDDDGYSSKARMSKKDFNLRMIDIITQNADDIDNNEINGQKVIRQAIQKYEQQGGKLWVKLSDYFIRLGQLQKARQCLQQAIKKIDNVKDFGIIFNAYCKFQQQMISVLGNKSFQQQQNVKPQDKLQQEIEERLNNLNNFIQRRPYLLHNINLRKNPNNVKQWIKLAYLYRQSGNQGQCLATFTTALQRIKPQQAWQGKLSQIVVQIGRMHQSHGNIKLCNQTMYNGTTINYRLMQDYINIWISWTQILIQQRYYNDALKIIKHLLFKRKSSQNQQLKIKNIDQLLKTHTNIWQLYIDLQISLGNFQSTKIAYQRCKQHRCLTPIMLLNFTQFLWKSDYFQQAFRVFQFAVGNFKWPSLFQIWIAYINKFISRYGQDGIGVQRTRSMFQRLFKQVPRDKSSIFYFIYAQFQQQYGLYSHSIQIYDRMVNSVPEQQRYQAYNIYIAKVSKILGITKTRAIFDIALKKLSQNQVLVLGRKYADLQTKMGQIERARAIYTYVSQFTDPKDDRKGLWQQWQKFQVQYGDKNTYKQHRRIKRSVEAKFLMLPPDLQKIQEDIKKGLVQ